jgi:hypothetical protein
VLSGAPVGFGEGHVKASIFRSPAVGLAVKVISIVRDNWQCAACGSTGVEKEIKYNGRLSDVVSVQPTTPASAVWVDFAPLLLQSVGCYPLSPRLPLEELRQPVKVVLSACRGSGWCHV